MFSVCGAGVVAAVSAGWAPAEPTQASRDGPRSNTDKRAVRLAEDMTALSLPIHTRTGNEATWMLERSSIDPAARRSRLVTRRAGLLARGSLSLALRLPGCPVAYRARTHRSQLRGQPRIGPLLG